MNTINSLAEKAYNNIPGKKNVALTEASVALIATLIIEILKAANTCKKNAEETTIMVNYPTKDEDKRLKAIVRKKLGWFQYWRHGAEYVEALKVTGKDTTLEDINNGLKEIKV